MHKLRDYQVSQIEKNLASLERGEPTIDATAYWECVGPEQKLALVDNVVDMNASKPKPKTKPKTKPKAAPKKSSRVKD